VVKKKLTETEKDSKIQLCVYQVINSRVDKGQFELTPELTTQLIESKLNRLKKQREALFAESR